MSIGDELHRAYFGEAWHGPSLTETLRGVTAEIAAARPIPGAHSIWELVLHLKAWIAEADATTRGKPYESLKGDRGWPPVAETSPAAWEQLLHGIAQHHAYHGARSAC